MSPTMQVVQALASPSSGCLLTTLQTGACGEKPLYERLWLAQEGRQASASD